MRAAAFVFLVACSNEASAVPPVAAPDAPPALPTERCTSPMGSAAITARGQDLEAQYTRIYAGGMFNGTADGGVPTTALDLRLLFTNAELTSYAALYGCYGAANCESGGFLVDANVQLGDEAGVHAATISSTTGAWSATGSLTVTGFDAPGEYLGRVTGSISVDASVTISGTFEHTFCLDLITVTL